MIYNMKTVYKRYLSFAAGLIAGIILVTVLLKRESGNNEAGTGPGDTVEAFIKALVAGDAETAKTYCDTLSMKEYIEALTEEYEKLYRKDSCVALAAARMMSETEVSIESVVKDGDRRKVLYTISAVNGDSKDKTAIVRKEEGAWKVERITDRE